MESAAEKLDLAAFHQSDLQFHSTIWDLAGNEHLTAALERVSFALFAFVLVESIGHDGAEFRGSARQHSQILEGLRSGDPGTARQAFLNSTLWFWREYHAIDLGKSCEQEMPEVSGIIGGRDLPDPGLSQEKTDFRPLK
jgi:DNA-binding GntR family transcriptional regulator